MRKLLSLLLAVTMVVCGGVLGSFAVYAENMTAPLNTASYMPGDVNADGLINNKDIVLLRRYVIGLRGTVISEPAADVNADNLINNKDIVLLRRYVIGSPGVELKPAVTDPTADGVLWFYEDFEDIPLSEDSRQTAASLGWTYNLTTDANFITNTASYSIRDYDGSRRFYIQNNQTNGKDSFITLLSERQFSFLHNLNYTYQYDVHYTDASDVKRYIVMISEYNGRDYYNSAHIRNGGYGNNQCYDVGTWYTFDSALATTGTNSIANKLLGKSYDATTGHFSGVDLSIRYSINWQTGNRVYIRVNTPGYPGSGVWTLVSQFDPAQNTSLSLGQDRGSAIAIKTGGKQNGYVDNIMIWSGNGDEPTDKSSPVLDSKMGCHQMVKLDGNECCILCGKTAEELANSWLLTELPRYEGGVHSAALYPTGQGIDPNQPVSKEGKMQIIKGTSESEFRTYLGALIGAGYTEEYSRDADGNLFRSYLKGSQRVYTYYTAATGESRVMTERTDVSAAIEDFGYTYTPKAGESSELYQYALPLRDATHLKADGYANNGMMYIIKLADNSVIVIDGGVSTQFPDAQVDNLMSFLREITGVGENGTVRIASWYLTHSHGDHYQGFALLLQKYHASIQLERVMYNLTSIHSDNPTISGIGGGLKKMLRYINTYYGNIPYLKAHTGQKIQLADVTFEVMYTHEDLVDPYTGISEVGTNYNESSIISKITWGGGKTFLLLGDSDSAAATTLIEQWNPERLQVDVVQMAHHVLNDLSHLYHMTKAPVVFVPQSLDNINAHKVSPLPYAAVKQYVKDSMCYFANEYTVGIGVVDGVIQRIYRRETVYQIKAAGW